MSPALKQKEGLLPFIFPQTNFLQLLLFEAVLFNWIHLQRSKDGVRKGKWVRPEPAAPRTLLRRALCVGLTP